MWSVALKAPNGRRVQWMDSPGGGWDTDESRTIDAWTHRTLLEKDWDSWILYNDEPPTGKVGGTCGHAKGAIVWNDSQAGWLIHSVPLWPPAFTETFDGKELLDNIPDKQVEFGQSFAWVSFDRARLREVLDQAALMQPAVYAANDAKGEWDPKKAPPERIRWLDFGDGLRHVAKNRQWGKCLFSDGLNAELGGPCVAETWCRPKPRPTADVFNAVVLGWPRTVPLVAYHESQDHSKWAISEGAERRWTFVGDINNMKSQWKRGGGGLVVAGDAVHDAFRQLVVQTDRPSEPVLGS